MIKIYLRALVLLAWVGILGLTETRIFDGFGEQSRARKVISSRGGFSQPSRLRDEQREGRRPGLFRRLSDEPKKDAKDAEKPAEPPIMSAHIDYPTLGMVNLGNGEFDFILK